MSEIKILGCMDNTVDHTFESANRVYDVDGIAPTIPTCAGGGIQPKVVEIQNIKEVPEVFKNLFTRLMVSVILFASEN